MNLYVIRHGEVDVNVKGQLNGRNTVSLTDNGILQAKEACKKLKNEKIDLIICSPLIRTKQTCELLNEKQLMVLYDDRILERNTNSLMYKLKNSIDLIEFYNPNNDLVYNDCEGFKSIIERINEFLVDIKNKYYNKNILIVTHHDVCKAFYSCINNKFSVDDIINFNQRNCEIIEYKI